MPRTARVRCPCGSACALTASQPHRCLRASPSYLPRHSKPDLKVLDEYGRKKPMPGAKINPMDGRAEPTEKASLSDEYAPPPGHEAGGEVVAAERDKQPGWLAATGGPAATAGAQAEDADAAEEEAARKEWLEYYMQTGELDQAEELVVTAEEREDLDYLKSRARRQ